MWVIVLIEKRMREETNSDYSDESAEVLKTTTSFQSCLSCANKSSDSLARKYPPLTAKLGVAGYGGTWCALRRKHKKQDLAVLCVTCSSYNRVRKLIQVNESLLRSSYAVGAHRERSTVDPR